MDATLINSFVDSFNEVIGMFSNENIEKKEVKLLEKALNTDVHTMVGVTGDVFGTVILGADRDNALGVVTMMSGMPATEFDDFSSSALQELLNMTSGSALTKIADLGFEADITPPTFFIGSGELRLPLPLLEVCMGIGDKKVSLNLSLKKRKVDHVLIVDDSVTFCKQAEMFLQPERSFKIVGKCLNGKQCLEFLQQSQPDIILLDMLMPDINGDVILETIKQHYPAIKVLMVSSLGQGYAQKFLQLGADGYLPKPFSSKSLLLALKNL